VWLSFVLEAVRKQPAIFGELQFLYWVKKNIHSNSEQDLRVALDLTLKRNNILVFFSFEKCWRKIKRCRVHLKFWDLIHPRYVNILKCFHPYFKG
jgi:hypothetical protein